MGAPEIELGVCEAGYESVGASVRLCHFTADWRWVFAWVEGYICVFRIPIEEPAVVDRGGSVRRGSRVQAECKRASGKGAGEYRDGKLGGGGSGE
jgi:hypothetical protein